MAFAYTATLRILAWVGKAIPRAAWMADWWASGRTGKLAGVALPVAAGCVEVGQPAQRHQGVFRRDGGGVLHPPCRTPGASRLRTAG